jgi:DNA invertase Pin-like site-specific DNA recombinase
MLKANRRSKVQGKPEAASIAFRRPSQRLTWASATAWPRRSVSRRRKQKPKLTPHQKKEALKRHGDGESDTAIAKIFNVHQSTISRMLRQDEPRRIRSTFSGSHGLKPSSAFAKMDVRSPVVGV